MEKKKDGFPNEKAIVIPQENLLRIKENPMTRLLHPTDVVLLVFSLLFSLCLLYRFIYLRSIRYHIGSEQLICEHGVFQRSVNYMELYRVVDFAEHQTLIQQLCGLKSVTVLSMDRTTPKLEMTGISNSYDVVSVIRTRVETNKRRKGVYEITNR